MEMPRALEEKMHNIWISELKAKEFKNRKVKAAFEKLNMWRLLSYVLVESHKEQFPEAYAGKERLVFSNKFEYFPKASGEYLLLTKDLLSIFAKGKVPVFIGNFPIFVQLKNVPVFWINGGIITLWDFYFPVSEIETMFEEVVRFSDKVAIFPRLEFTSFNFIQTYSSKPNQTLSFSTLQRENAKSLGVLEKYLTKNFWIIPETDIKDVNPFCSVFLREGTLLPCIPYRIIFKVLEVRRARTIFLLGLQIKCLEVLISYLNSSGNIQTDVIYFPTRLFNVSLEKERIYNGLLFTFVDFDKEWLYPVLFSFYEEDLRSYEILQELLLIFFKKRYIESKNLCSIDFNGEEFWDEIKYVTAHWWRKKMLPFSEDAFLRLEKKSALELLFSGLYPVLINSNDKIFHVPTPIGLLKLEKDQLKKLMEWCNAEIWDQSLHAFMKIGDVITSFSAYQEFVKDMKRKVLFIKYLKEMIIKMGEIH
jgi:hypothetical protein